MPPRAPVPADLHLHSVRSDGTELPRDVVYAAADAGMGTIALTDHDTVAGWDEAKHAARERGIALLPGAEFSTKHSWRSVHVLGYLFDPDEPGLAALMSGVRHDRVARARSIVDAIARDYAITWESVLAQREGDATIGRPHIADALVAAGIVPGRDEAFASILHHRGPYYVGHAAPSPHDVVTRIVAAGGVAIIAHPAGRDMLPRRAIERLVDAGLHGFELGHRENRPDGVALLREIAVARDLIVTGSSDYHGAAGKPNVIGENTTSPEMVERILRAGSGTDPVL